MSKLMNPFGDAIQPRGLMSFASLDPSGGRSPLRAISNCTGAMTEGQIIFTRDDERRQ